MKKLFAVLLLLVSNSAFAEPGLIQKMKMCTWYAAKAAEYTTLAAHTPKIEDYEAIVKKEVDGRQDNPTVQSTLVFLANVGWNSRDAMPTDVGLIVYDDCLNRTGTKA